MSVSRQQPDPSARAGATDEWFRRSFDAFYLELYAHRGAGEAVALAEAIARTGRRGPALEVACGAGRFLEALARRGERVAGLDLSAELLGEARRRLGPSAALARGDMRLLPFRSGRFSLVLSLFTSFAYFADRGDDERTLREAARVLLPGGHLLLDFLNARRTAACLVPESERRVRGLRVRETRWIDAAGPFLRKRTVVGEGPERVREERVRLYEPDELVELASRAGLTPVERWGDYAGAPFSAGESERFLLWARKGTV